MHFVSVLAHPFWTWHFLELTACLLSCICTIFRWLLNHRSINIRILLVWMCIYLILRHTCIILLGAELRLIPCACHFLFSMYWIFEIVWTKKFNIIFKCFAGGNVVLLYASKYHDIGGVVNLSGRYKLNRGIEERLGERFLERIKKDGYLGVKNRAGKCTVFLICQMTVLFTVTF